MLVLTRRVGETLVIGQDITVTVTEIRSGQVRLAIKAPNNVEVDRHEIRERKNADRTLEAAQAQAQGGGEVVEPMTGDLLPCPFCGKSNQDRWPCEWLDGTGANVIRCAWCHGAAPANTWNRRIAPTSAPVGVDRLMELIDAEILYNRDHAVGGRWSSQLDEARRIAAALAQQPAPSAPVGDVGEIMHKALCRIALGQEPAQTIADDAIAEARKAAIAQQPAAKAQAVAWPDGLLDRVKEAERRIENGHAPRRIPANPSDVDLVLAEVRALLEGCDPPFWIKPPSAPVGVEAVDAAAWNEVLELPEGFRVAEHLPGVWEYQFEIEDEADDDSDRKVSGTSWNHPALAAIAAWQNAYDAAIAQRPAAVTRCDDCHEPTGSRGVCEICADIRCDSVSKQPAAVDGAIRSLPALWRQREPDNGEDYTDYDRGYDQASDECADALEAALAAQPGGGRG